MNPFNYDPVTRLQRYDLDFGSWIYARPRTIVYYIFDVGERKWAVEGNTYPVREQLSISGAVWHAEGKRWLIPYTENNRIKLEEIRKAQ